MRTGVCLGVVTGLLLRAASAQAAEVKAADLSAACVAVPPEKIGFQLYNMLSALIPPDKMAAAVAGGPVTVSPATLQSVLTRMRAIGFRKMEGLGDRLPVPEPAYKTILQKTGIDQIGSHRPLDVARWRGSEDEAKALGQSHAGAPGFGEPGIGSLKDTPATAANLNKFGAASDAMGLRFYVHNHEDEIRTKYLYDLDHNGHPRMVSAWEIVAANTDPRLVHFEVDVHWTRVAFGLDRFADVLAFLRKYRSRIDLLHVKDTAADGSITDLGKGTTDWPAVFAAAGPQIRYYVWEYDGDPAPFESARIAWHTLRCER
jgi:sugar phosphate isomerase/epimerase